MRSALVLGGGGIVGYAWECGVLAGYGESADPFAFDAVVGTSAGAMAGAQVASGRLPRLSPSTGVRPSSMPAPDLGALGQTFALWGRIERTTPPQAAAIGRIARGIAREQEPAWIDGIGRLIDVPVWPVKPLFVMAVDTETGERRALDRDCGAAVAQAVAASAAIPGAMPSVGIGGRLYMDGQVHSSTHADFLLPYAPLRVVVVVPTNALTGAGIGGHADRMLAAEVDALRDRGCEVVVLTPGAEDVRKIGAQGLMDASASASAYAVGLEAGRGLARDVSALARQARRD